MVRGGVRGVCRKRVEQANLDPAGVIPPTADPDLSAQTDPAGAEAPANKKKENNIHC